MQEEKYSFIISLSEAYEYLIKNINVHNGSYMDQSDIGKISIILKELVYILLDQSVNYNETLDLIYKKLESNHYSRMHVQEICDTALSLISEKIIRFIPGLSDDRYRSKFTYNLIKRDTVIISLNKNELQ